MANLITVVRLMLLFVVVGFLSWEPVDLAPVSMVLIAVVFAGDGLDGYVARKRNSTSRFGAVFDIAGDRIVEMVLWVVFAQLGAIRLWVPLLVITRGSVVDALRSLSYAEGMTAFGERNMMRSSLTQWLTAGRFMRGFYGYAKALGFVYLAGFVAYERAGDDAVWIGSLYDVAAFRWCGWCLVWLAVILTVVRGVPVILDAMASFAGPAARPPISPLAVPRPSDATHAPGRQG